MPPNIDLPTPAPPDVRYVHDAALFFSAERSRPLLAPRSVASVREATAGDAAAVWHVVKSAVTPLIGRPYTRKQVEAWIADEAPRQFAAGFVPGAATFVAESDRSIIGYSRLRGAEVESLYVHPTHKGRRVGELLLGALEQSACVQGVRTLYLDAALNAERFYESAGYLALGPSVPLFDNGVPLPCVRMCKMLHFPLRQSARLYRCRPRLKSLVPAAWAPDSASALPSTFSRRML